MATHISLVFPGQGSQNSEMLDSFDQDTINLISSISNNILPFDLVEIIKNGSPAELNKTSVTQPALLITSYFFFMKLICDLKIKVDICAGHSLGEYSALVASDSIDIADALNLVYQRGLLMEKSEKGIMCAILGLDEQIINKICSTISDKDSCSVSSANLNAPKQIVIAGNEKGVIEAIKLCKEAGAKRCIELKVTVPSHCNLMKEASDKFREKINEVKINTPTIPLIQNYNAQISYDPITIKENLINQLTNPVQWYKTMNSINKYNGIIIECGPGKVLSGLAKLNGANKIFSMSSLNFDELKEFI